MIEMHFTNENPVMEARFSVQQQQNLPRKGIAKVKTEVFTNDEMMDI